MLAHIIKRPNSNCASKLFDFAKRDWTTNQSLTWSEYPPPIAVRFGKNILQAEWKPLNLGFGAGGMARKGDLLMTRKSIDKAPTQLKLPFALWTRDAVHLAVKKQFGVVLPLRTITDYFKRWGFTPQKPVKRAYEQDSKKVQIWLDKTYPAIAAKAKKEKAEIHWGDETGVQNSAFNAKGFAPQGQPPLIRLSAKKCRVNMMSSITNFGKVRFMLYRENMTSAVLIRFMSRLIKDVSQKVLLVLDNLRVHHSKLVAAWLAEHKKQIEVFFLPPYSPEHNPDEYLNGDLKNHIRSGLPSRTESDLSKKTRSFMKMLQKRPNRVSNYFKHPLIAYAG